MAEAAIVEHRRGFRRRWYRTPSFVAGRSILGAIVLLALFAPLVTTHDPTNQDLLHTLAGPIVERTCSAPTTWAATSGRASSTARAPTSGSRSSPCSSRSSSGRSSAWSPATTAAWSTRSTSWLVNVVVAFPFYVLIIALVFVLGPGTRNIYIAITIVGWVSYARIVRGEVLVAKRREYVLAARSGGLSDRRILFRHLLPNVITQAIVFAMSDIVLCILAIVTLGYLGLGVQPPTPDWGRMIADGQTYLTTNWELSTVPGIAVVITALGLSLLADGLADLLRPE